MSLSDDAFSTLEKACERMDEDGDTYSFNVEQGTGRITLTLDHETDAFSDVRILLNADGTYEVYTSLTKKQELFKRLRDRFDSFSDWDDDEMKQLLDELDVEY